MEIPVFTRQGGSNESGVLKKEGKEMVNDNDMSIPFYTHIYIYSLLYLIAIYAPSILQGMMFVKLFTRMVSTLVASPSADTGRGR